MGWATIRGHHVFIPDKGQASSTHSNEGTQARGGGETKANLLAAHGAAVAAVNNAQKEVKVPKTSPVMSPPRANTVTTNGAKQDGNRVAVQSGLLSHGFEHSSLHSSPGTTAYVHADHPNSHVFVHQIMGRLVVGVQTHPSHL